MEKLALCSKLLYDDDLLKLKRELINKKNELKRLEDLYDLTDNIPKVLFNSCSELYRSIDLFFNRSEKYLNKVLKNHNGSIFEKFNIIKDKYEMYLIKQLNILIKEKNSIWSEKTIKDKLNNLYNDLKNIDEYIIEPYHYLTISLYINLYIRNMQNGYDFDILGVYKCVNCNIITNDINEDKNMLYCDNCITIKID
jgi:hypothetical protein